MHDHTPMTRLIIVGASGRMGLRLLALGHADPRCAMVGAAVRDDSSHIGAPALAAISPAHVRDATSHDPLRFAGVGSTFAHADAVIDFSNHASVLASIALAQRTGAALLVGTTGLGDAHIAALKAASRERAVLLAPNTSLGVCVLNFLVGKATRLLGHAFELSLVEAHHSAKKDAPSGTALRLARTARDAGGALPDHQILAMRGGDVVGEHTLRFAGPGEYLELTHRATSRDLFARGALTAAHWLKGRSAGWYTMEHVLGLVET